MKKTSRRVKFQLNLDVVKVRARLEMCLLWVGITLKSGCWEGCRSLQYITLCVVFIHRHVHLHDWQLKMHICLNLDLYLIIFSRLQMLESVLNEKCNSLNAGCTRHSNVYEVSNTNFSSSSTTQVYSSRKWCSLKPFFKTNFGQLVISKSLVVAVKNNYVYNSKREFNCT